MAPTLDRLEFSLSSAPEAKPLDRWGSLWTEQLACQVRFVHGARWRHRIIESGSPDHPALLLLHGIGAHAEWWARNTANLGTTFHVVAPDLVFHGKSGKNDWDRKRWIPLLADGAIDLMDAMNWSGAFIEGASLGAHVAFNLGMRYPSRCRSVILNTGLPRVQRINDAPAAEHRSTRPPLFEHAITTPSFPAMQTWMQGLVAEPARMTDEMVETRLRIYRDPETNAAIRRIYGIGSELPHKMIYTLDQVRSFTPAPLVLWTQHNPGKPWDEASRLVHTIPGARYYVIADAGHWPQWEKPEEHDRIVTEWFLGG